MISVIVYGRNDDHGYNLHRRAALSLNCIAHVLGDPDDEIVFVDYNTPPGLPVFPEAILDTLTDAAVDRLRVIRVPAEVHARRYGARTHLDAVEPVARNVALRRSNPANRWVLSTNTDMVLVPNGARSLSEIAAELQDGYWAIPRFQLPEALWERLDRRAPDVALSTIDAWGRRFRLDEPITSYDWMAFDAPGDFQLVPRDWLWAVDGFDESMLSGWHVDSNIARRLSLVYGPAHDLQERVRGYHCDHTRVPGVFHSSTIANDVERYVFGVDRSEVLAQASSWGLADVVLEEIDLAATVAGRLPAALEAALPAAAAPLPAVDARDAPGHLSYRPDHVVPYVASALSTLPRRAVIAYVGANPDLVVLLVAVLTELGFESPLRVLPTGAGLEPAPAGTTVAPQIEVEREADAIIVDFGLPVGRATVSEPTRPSHWTADDRRVLDWVLRAFDDLTGLDASDRSGARPLRTYVVVNAVYNALEGAVDDRLTGGSKQFATRVRHGRARAPRSVVSALPRFSIGLGPGGALGRYVLGQTIDLTHHDGALHLQGAWGVLTDKGISTDGRRAGIVLDIDPQDLETAEEPIFTVRVDRACDPRRRDSRVVGVEVGGELVGEWRFVGQDRDAALHRLPIDSELLRRERPARIDLVVHDAVPPIADAADPRDPGVLVSGVSLDHCAPVHTGTRIELTDPGIPSPVLWSGWSYPEHDGTWSIGATSVLRVPPVTGTEGDETFDLVVELADAFVRPGQDPLGIQVVVDEAEHDLWSFDRLGAHEHRLTLPVRDVPTFVTLRQPAAVSCSILGESPDPRRLGCKVAAVTAVRSGGPS